MKAQEEPSFLKSYEYHIYPEGQGKVERRKSSNTT